MSLSKASKLKEILADEGASKVLQKYLGEDILKDKRIALMKGLTLTQLQPMSQGMVSPEMLDQIDADLRALG
ncbi:MAG: hypothetical protein AB2L09_07260 [Coriobacteriia bacterium]